MPTCSWLCPAKTVADTAAYVFGCFMAESAAVYPLIGAHSVRGVDVRLYDTWLYSGTRRLNLGVINNHRMDKRVVNAV